MAQTGGRDPEQAMRDFEARLDASAFGRATKASYRLESEEEDAHVAGASNLLEKALRRLGDGNDEAAAALVRRAVAIAPTLEREALPAVVAAELLLYSELTDRHDRANGDPGWLDPVLAVYERASGAVRQEFGGMLDALRAGELSGAEERRIRAVVPVDSRRSEPLAGVTDAEERAEVVLAMLRLLSELSGELTPEAQ